MFFHDAWAWDGDSIHVVISEVLWMGSDLSTADEWVELTGWSSNVLSQPLSLSGWTLTSQNSAGNETVIARFPSGLSISSGASLIVSNYDRAHSRLDIDPACISTTMSLPNTKLLLRLRDRSGALIDSIDDGVGNPFAGTNTSMAKASMERIDLATAGNEITNWKAATVSLHIDSGSIVIANPGVIIKKEPSIETQNSSTNSIQNVCPTMAGARIIVQSGVLSGIDPVTVNVQAAVDSGSLVGSTCTWDFGDGFTSTSCNPGVHTLRSVGPSALSLTIVNQCGNTVTQSLPTFVEAKRSASPSSEVAEKSPTFVCKPVTFSGVSITELFPNPSGTELDQEWIELHNETDHMLPLCGWQLDDAIGQSKPYDLSGFQIPGNEYLVFPSAKTKVGLNNDHDAVRLIGPYQQGGTGVLVTLVYDAAPENKTYALDRDGEWRWTDFPSLNAPNIFASPNLEPQKEEVSLSAALPNPEGDDEFDEWVSIKNVTVYPIWLNGWYIRNHAGKKFTLDGIVLGHQEALRIELERTGFVLGNTQEQLQLYDRAGSLQSVLVWKNAKSNQVVRAFSSQEKQEATVLRVVDGETIQVAIGSHPEKRKIRVLGIDSPDLLEEGSFSLYGLQSKNFLSDLIINKKVVLEFDSISVDADGKIPAYVRTEDHIDIARTLLAAGQASADRRSDFHRKNEYIFYEEKAREENYGLWADAAYRDLADVHVQQQLWQALAEEEGVDLVVSQQGRVASGTVIDFKSSLPVRLFVSEGGSSFRSLTGSYIVSADVTLRYYAETLPEVGIRKRSTVAAASFIVDGSPTDAQIILHEISPSSNPEWIELFNTSDFDADISGWVIDDEVGKGSKPYMLPPGTSIPAQGVLVLDHNQTGLSLRNTGEEITLSDSEGGLRDSVSYPSVPKDRSYAISNQSWCLTRNPTPLGENICVTKTPPKIKKSVQKKSPKKAKITKSVKVDEELSTMMNLLGSGATIYEPPLSAGRLLPYALWLLLFLASGSLFGLWFVRKGVYRQK